MDGLKIIPRIRIDGVYYTLDEIPKEKSREIIKQRIDLGLSGINYTRKAAG